jgi:RNA polymerase sigma-70 factor (ECF subfamily)
MTAPLDQVRASIISLLPRLRRFARTITRNHDDADDLVQMAVERGLERYEQWRPQSGFEGWMFGIVRTAWIDELRARQRHRVHPPADEDENGAIGESEGEKLLIQTALGALADDQRMAIALVLIEGLSYEDAAAALDVSIGTLTSRLARGREALQTLL